MIHRFLTLGALMSLTILLAYLLLGAGAGVLAGLFGVGGGLIVVPVLMFSFTFLNLSEDVATHLAIGTSLATIIFTSMSSAQAHNSKGSIDWKIVRWLALGIVFGSVLGGFTASLLQGATLKIIIGCFVILMSIQLGFNLKPKASKQLPGKFGLSSVGVGVGWASAIFGIGGGSLTVPFLAFCSVPMQRAVGVSAACGLPIAIAGTLSYMWFGWGVEGLPEWSFGYIYLPALIGITATSMVFSRIGAKLAYRLSPDLLRRMFAVFLLIVGCSFFTPL